MEHGILCTTIKIVGSIIKERPEIKTYPTKGRKGREGREGKPVHEHSNGSTERIMHVRTSPWPYQRLSQHAAANLVYLLCRVPVFPS